MNWHILKLIILYRIFEATAEFMKKMSNSTGFKFLPLLPNDAIGGVPVWAIAAAICGAGLMMLFARKRYEQIKVNLVTDFPIL